MTPEPKQGPEKGSIFSIVKYRRKVFFCLFFTTVLLSVEGNGRKRSCERKKVKSALNVLSRLKNVSNMMIVN